MFKEIHDGLDEKIKLWEKALYKTGCPFQTERISKKIIFLQELRGALTYKQEENETEN